ncbi:MAG: ATP-dependent helicase [Tindallia sp. MSAO_Bac2]|nr:MAG: ATP-dependent helicase [Tindallia sp. MSAO_Bac2]
MLGQWLKKQYNISFNDQQLEVMKHQKGPALVLAVAGAGKTTCLCSRTAKLILEGNVKAEKICTLTFSKAAARDMKTRFDMLFHNHALNIGNVYFSTIHSFCYRIMKYHCNNTQTPLRLIEGRSTAIDKNTLLRKIYYHYNKEYMTEDTLEEVDRLIGFAKNRLLQIEEIKNLDTGLVKFPLIYQAYENYKTKNQLLDFNDLLTKTYYLLKENQYYLRLFSNQYDYWQVDEFQDTSPVQWEIIKLMAGTKQNLLCVGDDDQTIYSFRGSSPETMLKFNEVYPHAKTYYMEENFRSGTNNIDICKQLIQLNKNRYQKNIFTNNDDREMPTVIIHKDENEQLEETIASALNLLDKNNQTTIGILCRKNLSIIPFLEAFNDFNLPVKIRDNTTKTLKHWIINDILNIIDFAYSPWNENIFNSIYYRMNAYISRKQLDYATKNKKQDQHILSVMAKDPNLEEYQAEKLHKLTYELERLKNKKGSAILSHILYSIGYMDFLERNASISKSSADHFISIINYIMRKTDNPLEWRKKIIQVEENVKDACLNQHSPISLTTIHSAKGLEYDYVFVVDVSENIFPSIKAGKQVSEANILEQVEEERRLLYVAMTRARYKVTVSAPEMMMKCRQENSMFMDELKTLISPQKSVTNKLYNSFRNYYNQKTPQLKLSEGVVVEHIKFGKGIVLSKDHGSIRIRFDGKDRKISLDYAHKVLKAGDVE